MCYLIDYTWCPSSLKWLYRKIADLPGEITVRDKDGERKPLNRKEPHEAEKWLGFYPAPDGNSQQQVSYLLQRVQDFTNRIRSTGRHLKNDVWKVTKMTIQKTLDYPMKAIRLTCQEWDSIMKPLWATVLPRSGFSRNFPRAVLYAPHKFHTDEFTISP